MIGIFQYFNQMEICKSILMQNQESQFTLKLKQNRIFFLSFQNSNITTNCWFVIDLQSCKCKTNTTNCLFSKVKYIFSFSQVFWTFLWRYSPMCQQVMMTPTLYANSCPIFAIAMQHKVTIGYKYLLIVQ